MDRLEVSKVARGIEPSSQTNEGWVQAYIATGGNPVAMSNRLTGRNDHETWMDRRKQFLARHLEKVRRDNEPLWRNGEPTRRHLALVAWGYSPTISKLQKWLKTQPSLASGEWKKGVKTLKKNPQSNRKNGAPGYQSYGWTTQDWRSIFLHSDGSVSYDKKCGAKGTKLPSGKPRLCLPLYVIKQLLKTKNGKKILIQQARKKQRAEKGKRIPWHPKIKELHSKLESKTPLDDPKLKRKNPNTISQFFIDRQMPSMMVDDTLIIECDADSLALLQDYSHFLGIHIHPMIEDNHIHIHSDDWDTTFIHLHELFN